MSTPREPLQAAWTAGCMGDSITDEYFDRMDNGRNWVELLAMGKRLDFGAFKPQPDKWDDIRRSGYEYNWANGQAPHGDSLDAASHQALGLAQQVKNGKVRIATLGVNHDYFYCTGFGPPHFSYTDIYEKKLAGPKLAEYTGVVVANLTRAIDIVREAGQVGVILFNIVDFGVIPYILEGTPGVAGPWLNPAGREKVAAAVADANRQLEAVAQQRRIPVIDLFKFMHFVNKGGPVIVGGVTLNLTAYSHQRPADPHNFFIDSQHPGTIASGLFANMVILASNKAYGSKIDLLTDQEILQYASIPAKEIPPPEPPLYFDVSPYVKV